MNPDYICVLLMLIFSFWSLHVTLVSHPMHFPFGKWGRWASVGTSTFMCVACVVVLMWQAVENLKSWL